MSRQKADVPMTRKHWHLPERHALLLAELREMLGATSDSEVLRHIIVQAHILASAVKAGDQVVLRGVDGVERQLVFLV